MLPKKEVVSEPASKQQGKVKAEVTVEKEAEVSMAVMPDLASASTSSKAESTARPKTAVTETKKNEKKKDARPAAAKKTTSTAPEKVAGSPVEPSSDARRKKQIALMAEKYSGKANPQTSESESVKEMIAEGKKSTSKKRKAVGDESNGAEKRASSLRKKPAQTVLERMERMSHQSLYCLHREQHFGRPTPSSSSSRALAATPDTETFKICGSTGNVYTVKIGLQPNCDCPDAIYNRSTVCKHILFVFMRVLGVAEASHVWFQKALTASELREIFTNARPDPSSTNASLARAYAAHVSAAKSEWAAEEDDGGLKRLPNQGDTCPICYEEFLTHQMDTLWFCRDSCGNPLHRSCAQEWARARPQVRQPSTCIYCRAPVDVPPLPGAITAARSSSRSPLKGDYVNMAPYSDLISPERDYSVYRPWSA